MKVKESLLKLKDKYFDAKVLVKINEKNKTYSFICTFSELDKDTIESASYLIFYDERLKKEFEKKATQSFVIYPFLQTARRFDKFYLSSALDFSFYINKNSVSFVSDKIIDFYQKKGSLSLYLATFSKARLEKLAEFNEDYIELKKELTRAKNAYSYLTLYFADMRELTIDLQKTIFDERIITKIKKRGTYFNVFINYYYIDDYKFF